MDNPAIFDTFLQNVLGVTLVRTRKLITEFTPTFGSLLGITDDDIDTFSKEAHSSNSARTATQRIMISSTVTQGLKSIVFELKDRELCDALPDYTMLQNIN